MGGRFLKYWVPLLLWMALIFVASTKAGGPGISSYFLHLVLRWLDPGINAEHFEVVHIGVRKTAHLTEYAGLGYLALRTARAEIPQAESRPAIAFAPRSSSAPSTRRPMNFIRVSCPRDILRPPT